jgi:hypothetical protein
MNRTLTTFYLIQKIKQEFFLYYIFCEENKFWENFKIMRKLLFSHSLYSHPEIPMNTRTQTLPLGAFSKAVPANPQD